METHGLRFWKSFEQDREGGIWMFHGLGSVNLVLLIIPWPFSALGRNGIVKTRWI